MNGASHLRVAIIVQARMGASRLPGKPLKQVLGKSLLSYLIERLKQCKTVDRLCIATTTNPQDDVIARAAEKAGVDMVRGSEEDVLARYVQAAQVLKCDLIVRITADCPLMDPALIDQLVTAFKTHSSKVDYLSNTLKRTYPRGMDVEVFSHQALKKAAQEALLPEEREHVTLYMYRHPELFYLENFSYPQDHSNYRWTVDTPEDFVLIKHIIEALYPINPHFNLADILQLMQQHRDWALINQHIPQKLI